MLITIKVPDDTARVEYAVMDESGYVGDCRPVTIGQVVRVEPEPEPDPDADAEMLDIVGG